MKLEIERIIVNHFDRKISLGEAVTQIQRLFAEREKCNSCGSKKVELKHKCKCGVEW